MFHAWTFPSICIELIKKTHLNHATRPHPSIKCQWRNGFAVKRYIVCVRQKFKFIMASAKAKVAKLEGYEQKFRKQWLLDKKFKKWLDRTTINDAYCKWCRVNIHLKLSVIKFHGESKRQKFWNQMFRRKQTFQLFGK